MLLMNLMEDKQLNLNQPLLSVRRYASTVVAEKDAKRSTKSFLPTLPRPPHYKSELKSGPVSNPGVVPFVWEQSPGKPKDESRHEIHQIDKPPTVPKLPPGRILKANQQDSDNAPANPTINKNQVGNPDDSWRIPAMDAVTTRVECSEDTVEEEKSDSGDDSEVYLDALDTLSRTESFFMNCSVSGVSGLDDQDVKRSGTFSTDPQAREFMIGRFLPAAKAMTSETQMPQYVPKKQPVILDQPRQLKKVTNADKRPQLRYGPSFVQHYTQSQYNREEDSDDDYNNESGNLPTKVCGLLPRFCLRSSFCLLNPVPGMSVRTRVPMSPASRLQTRSSSASTCSKTENEQSSFDISEQRSTDGSQTTEVLEEKNCWTNKPKQICSDSQKLEGTYPHRYFLSGGMSHCKKESSLSHDQRSIPGISREENNSRGGGFSSHDKNYKSFEELLANQSNSEELDVGSPAGEMTLYIDSVHKDEYPQKKSCSSKGKELSNTRKQDNEILKNGMEENFSKDSGCMEKLSVADERFKLQNNFQKSGDFNQPSLADKANQETEKESSKAFGQDEKLHLEKISSADLGVPNKEATKGSRKQTPKISKLENSQGILPEFPIPPPLPKSPSDSWLCRALPSMNWKNSSLHSHFATGISPKHHQASKTQSTDAKWETIVKTTKVQQHHFRYSEEILAPIPEN